jgi:hypothetical protein
MGRLPDEDLKMGHPGISSAVGGVDCETQYEVRNAIGTLLLTSPDLALAKKWLSERAAQWPGAQVDEVCRWETRRRVFKPIGYLRSVK